MENNEKIEWSALEYEQKDRGVDWFWALGIIIIAGSITSFIYDNFFFGILLIIAGIMMFVFAIKKPELVFYEINKKGLKIKNRLYPFENIQAFYIEKSKNPPILFIKSERYFLPIIPIPLKQNLIDEIKELMLKNGAKEEEIKEHFSEKIMEFIGF